MTVKYTVRGECRARQGVMVAYRGALEFERQGQGVGNALKRAVTGEGLALMTVRGEGEAWFASNGAHSFLVDLEGTGDALSVNGKNVLCFDSALEYEISTTKGVGVAGGSLFTCLFSGRGRLALTCEGAPLVIPVTPDAPVRVDTDAIVAWSASLATSLERSQSVGSMLRGGSGEAVQLKFDGEGFVVVRPGEPEPAPKGGQSG